MGYARWLRFLLAGMAFAALVATAGVPLPGADRLGLSGTAAAQAIDIDYFYNELDPYGEWVWHPRFGYVWLPGNVSESWRPYTVGHWVYTDEYGWYWDSFEPFAWAVYHYGRWGYDEDYGWFWVPGDTWAPAWVQWRYGDNYVGWAPIGPRRRGYSYGLPLSYEPSVAEAWVFVQPRYLTSRSIYRYALPPSELGLAFSGATNVYRPEFRGGGVYNFGVPRDRVVRFYKTPIIVQKVYRVDRKGDRYGKFDGGHGIRVFAPGFEKGVQPNHKPKRFSDSPFDLKPKAKLQHTFEGKPPKGWGPSATEVQPIAKEVGPKGFKPWKHDGQDQGNDKEQGNVTKGQTGPNGGQGQTDTSDADKGDKDKRKGFGSGGPGAPKGPIGEGGQVNGTQGPGAGAQGDQGNQGGEGQANWKKKGFGQGQGNGVQGGEGAKTQGDKGDQGNQGGDGQANWKKKGFGQGQGNGVQGSEGAKTQGDQGDQGNQGGDGQANWKKKGFGPGFQNGQGNGTQGPGAGAQGGQGNGTQGPGAGAQGGQGGGDGNKDKKDKCKKHPEQPECQKN